MHTLTILLIYFLSFTDKPFLSHPALSPRALALREAHSIELDSLDYPVSPLFLDSVRRMGGEVLYTSRWMNGATVRVDASDSAMVLARWRACSFIGAIELTRSQTQPVEQVSAPRTAAAQDSLLYGDALEQLNVYNLLPLHHAGFHGEGIRMAIIDGGFACADTMAAFRDKIIAAYDMTDDTTSVYDPSVVHGTNCLSIIVGRKDGYCGAAPSAQVVLIRSEENNTESLKEVDNLVASLELADSMGLQIASISLGYSLFDDSLMNYTHEQLDGHYARCSRAASIAARKGMLVCCSAGNERSKAWGKITPPADAEGVLTVGAVGYDSLITSFSSYGPTADGRIKPEVCAVGEKASLLNAKGEVCRSNGTSFSCPLMAGLAACLWSALPEASAAEIRERIIRSAHRYGTPDNDFGYGIPNAWEAYMMEPTTAPSVSLEGEASTCLGPEKVLLNGQLFIRVNGRVYHLLGMP